MWTDHCGINKLLTIITRTSPEPEPKRREKTVNQWMNKETFLRMTNKGVKISSGQKWWKPPHWPPLVNRHSWFKESQKQAASSIISYRGEWADLSYFIAAGPFLYKLLPLVSSLNTPFLLVQCDSSGWAFHDKCGVKFQAWTGDRKPESWKGRRSVFKMFHSSSYFIISTYLDVDLGFSLQSLIG